ncbi:MAG: hypothetical protein PHI85_05060 [Victivallaceae bacterium]|nr:hypothetical protein [Victivallaceae bacterium]
MLISKCVMHFADCTINDFHERNMPSIGSALTVANKFVALSRDLKVISDLLYKIDNIAMAKIKEAQLEK